MKRLDNANEKIQSICEQIKYEALEPAKLEARHIIEQAQKEAEKIKLQALKELEEEKERTFLLIEKEKKALQTSIQQSIKQGVDKLKNEVVNVFNDSFSSAIEFEVSKTDVLVKLINSICEALSKEGIYSPIHLTVGQKVEIGSIAKELAQTLKIKLVDGPLQIGSFAGGAEIKLQGKNLTIDISDKAVKDLFSSFLKRPDFRALIFKE